MKIDEKFNAKLLVEGNDDQHVIWAICKKHEIAETFDVIDNDSISRVLKRLPVDLKDDSVEILGVIVDADQNMQAIWQSLRDRLSPYGYQIPDEPNPEGFIHATQDIYPRIGIWLMPDNLQSGMLEDFVKLLIRPDDLLSPFVEKILFEIEGQDISNRYNKDIHRAKAFVHTWLAWQQEPGRPMGTAITATYLDHNTDLCLRFVNWLNHLFNPQ